MPDAILISLLIVGISNAILTLYLIYLIRFDKETSQRAMSLIKARYSTEQILQDMSIIISETTEKFEEQTRKVQEQVYRHLNYANASSAKLNSVLTSICDEVSNTASSYGYSSNFKSLDEFENSVSSVLKDEDSNITTSNNIILDNLEDNEIELVKTSSEQDKELSTIYDMIDKGYSASEIASLLNIKEKKVQVLINTSKLMEL